MPFTRKTQCPKGHSLVEGDPNVYVWVTKTGTKMRSCRKCRNRRTRASKRPHVKHKGDHCEICGFIALNECQLDVHHLDNNHANNEESNLQTLCANCHRLVTVMSKG